MEFKVFQAGKDDDGRRIDRILKNLLKEENLSSLYKSLRKGLIKVNGKKVEGNFKISENDEIRIAEFLLSSDVENENSQGKELPQEIIVFRNKNLLILNKPYDIPVQPSSNKNLKSLSEMVQEDFASRKKESLAFKTGPLHRLDRKTTGLIAFSQSIEGARIFSEAIKSHNLEKIYLGIVLGNLKEKQKWFDKIQKKEEDENFHTVKVLSKEDENGKIADTEAIPIEHEKICDREITLVKFIIGSGRTHQIRSQSSSHGFPLLGDSAYGGEAKNMNLPQDFFLHAYELNFKDEKMRTALGLPEKVHCDVPENFSKIINKMLKNSSLGLIF